VVVPALARVFGIPVDSGDVFVDCGAVGVRDLHGGVGHACELAVFHERDAVGVVDERGDVASEIRGVIVESEDERGVLARRVHRVLSLGYCGKRVAPFELFDGPAERSVEIVALGAVRLDEMGNDLGVATEVVALAFELCAEFVVVLDDAVVDDRDLVGAVRVGMGVGVRRLAMRAPACVADADCALRSTVRALSIFLSFPEVRRVGPHHGGARCSNDAAVVDPLLGRVD